jgi:branched-chain amino acid transport system ATP-binding protein
VSALRLDRLDAGYNGGTVVHGVSIEVRPGTVHAVVGHNGAGKSTLLHTVAGLIRASSGRVLLGDRDLTRLPAHRRTRAGIGYVPQGARVFATLTVAEHLAIAQRRPRAGGWNRRRVLELLPRLGERSDHRGAQLSGGEKQMLAIARALLTQPSLLLLDEPTEGLAPLVVEQIQRTVSTLAADGLGILLATPQPDFAMAVAGEVTVLTAGRATTTLAADELGAAPTALHSALALGATAPASQAPPAGQVPSAGQAPPAGGPAAPADDEPDCGPDRRAA